LWHIRHNIVHDYIGVVAFRQSLDEGAANEASPNNSYLTSHYALSFQGNKNILNPLYALVGEKGNHQNTQ